MLYAIGMQLVVIAHNIRSTHNVGSILRTADGFGVSHVYLTGYTPYPTQANDTRLPHERDKITAQIRKTALGAETTVPTQYSPDPLHILNDLKAAGFTVVALEQTPTAASLDTFSPPNNCALLLGEEVRGITPELLNMCDVAVEIPMRGRKESFNVSVAAGIALYQLSKTVQ